MFHYRLLTPADTVNTTLGIILSIAFLLLVAATWVLTYLNIPPISKKDKTIFVDKEVIFDIGSN